jgi:hypothetical protein
MNDQPQTRALSSDTIAAITEYVAAAKLTKWQQPDLRRFFGAHGVDLPNYIEAMNGKEVAEDIAAALISISIIGLPDKPPAIEPNAEDIRRHIEWLIEPARWEFDDALIEIAYERGGQGPNAARLFGFDEIDDAVTFAVEHNNDFSNVYIGAALRSPEADRNKRASAADFYVATAVPIDIDTDYDATRARMASICDDGLIITTGLTPARRSQHWTRLTRPCDDDLDFEAAFAALVIHTGADQKVKDSARVMRLGGTVSYPNDRKKAAGYQTELTGVSVVTSARASDIEALAALSPDGAPTARAEAVTRPAGPSEIATDWTGRVTDGRESHFRDLLLTELRVFQETNGTDPEPAELFDLAFKRFSDPAVTDNADGRWTGTHGRAQLLARTRNTLRRLRDGRLARTGLYSIETEAGRDEALACRAKRSADTAQTGATNLTLADASAGLVFNSYRWISEDDVPDRDILYGQHIFRKFLSATVAPGGLGKSSLVMAEALAMVTGRNLLGEAPQRPLSVYYWNGEDPMEELQRRFTAATKHYCIKEADLGGRLFVGSGRETEIVVVREDRDGFRIMTPVVDALVQQVRANKIDVLIIDPFVACHAVSENDNTKIEAVVKQWMRVAEEGGCAVELVHHVRKPGGIVQDTTVDDARGAGALLAKMRSARVLNGMSGAEADQVGIERKDRWQFFRVDNGKANLVPRGGDARWRRMISVTLGKRVNTAANQVGVVTDWIKPSAFEGITTEQLDRAMAGIEAGEWRLDAQCSNWVGVPVATAMGLDLDTPMAKGRVRSMVTTWLRNGVLEQVQKLDNTRRMRAFVTVGKGV